MGTDIFPPEKRREVMRRIRSRGTGPEKRIAELLDSLGVEYVYQARIGRWRVDFLIPGARLVIEYRDCFWHWCPRCYGDRVPVKGGILGREWWARKLARNRERDRRKEEELRRMGYHVEVIWKHDDLEARLAEILRAYSVTGPSQSSNASRKGSAKLKALE